MITVRTSGLVRSTIPLAAIFLALAPSTARAAITMSCVGSWTVNVQLVGPSGGSDTYESPSGQLQVSVTGISGRRNWTVTVRRSTTGLPPGATLYIRRTGNGSGTGSIAGGTAYQELTTGDVLFFTGTGPRTAIYVQVKLYIPGVLADPTTYVNQITYTAEVAP
jgi:hypothetical protein